MHKCEEIQAKVHPCNVNISSFPRFSAISRKEQHFSVRGRKGENRTEPDCQQTWGGEETPDRATGKAGGLWQKNVR